MIARIFTLIFCLMLCGCVLQSPAPIFAEKDGKLILQPFGKQFATFNMESGEWKKQTEIVKFDPDGNHYLIHDKAGDIHVLFAALNDNWWVVQAQEPGKPSAYLLARFEGKSLVMNILSCKVLKTNKTLQNAIAFTGEDCTANAQMTKDKFANLTTSPEPALLKIEAVQ